MQILSRQFQIVTVVFQQGEGERTGYFLSGTYQLNEITRKRYGSITLHQLSVEKDEVSLGVENR